MIEIRVNRCQHIPYLEVVNSVMSGSCAKSAEQVIVQKTLRSPIVLDGIPEHPKREHVEKNMLDGAVHEHVCHELVYAELGGSGIMKTQVIGKIKLILECNGGQEKNAIDDQQVLNHRWQQGHLRGTIIIVHKIKGD